MRILHVIRAFDLGGSERVACDLAAEHVKEGHELCIAALQKNDPANADYSAALLKELHEAGVNTHCFDFRKFRLAIPAMVLKLLTLRRRWRPDIVHSHVDRADFVVSSALRFTRFPVFRTIHNTRLWPTRYWAGRWSERGFREDAVAAVSNDAMRAYQELRKSYGLPLAKEGHVILNGVPPPKSMHSRGDQTGLRMAFFGRRAAQKGLDVLRDAVGIVVTNGRVSASLDVFSDERQLSGNWKRGEKVSVSLLPVASDARQRMSSYDIVIVPSRFEGLPLVPLEAMAAGVPILASAAPGLREVTPPDWPLVFPIEDAQALAALIERICAGEFDLKRLGAEGREFAARFSVKKMASAYMGAYCDLLKRGE